MQLKELGIFIIIIIVLIYLANGRFPRWMRAKCTKCGKDIIDPPKNSSKEHEGYCCDCWDHLGNKPKD